MAKAKIPDRSEVTEQTPLLLEVAARVAFPDGSMSGRVLRNAANCGDLEYERLGSRIYTTLAAINDWRAACRQKAKPRASGGGRLHPVDRPRGLTQEEDGKLAYAHAMRVIERRKQGITESKAAKPKARRRGDGGSN